MSDAHTPASSGSDVTDVTPKDKTSAPAGAPPAEPPSSATKTVPEPGCGCGGNGDATAKAAAKPTPPEGGVPIGKWTRTWELQLPKDADPCAGTTTAHFVQSGADQFSCLGTQAAAPAAASESRPAPAPTPVPAGRREEERKQQVPPWVWVLLALLGLALLWSLFGNKGSAAPVPPVAPPPVVAPVAPPGGPGNTGGGIVSAPAGTFDASVKNVSPSGLCQNDCDRAILAVWHNGTWAGFNAKNIAAQSIRQTASGFMVMGPTGGQLLSSVPVSRFWTPAEMDAKADAHQWVMVTLDQNGQPTVWNHLGRKTQISGSITTGSFIDVRVTR